MVIVVVYERDLEVKGEGRIGGNRQAAGRRGHQSLRESSISRKPSLDVEDGRLG